MSDHSTVYEIVPFQRSRNSDHSLHIHINDFYFIDLPEFTFWRRLSTDVLLLKPL